MDWSTRVKTQQDYRYFSLRAIWKDCLWEELSFILNLHWELISLRYRRLNCEADRPSCNDLVWSQFILSYTNANSIVNYAQLKDNEVGSVDSSLP